MILNRRQTLGGMAAVAGLTATAAVAKDQCVAFTPAMQEAIIA